MRAERPAGATRAEGKAGGGASGAPATPRVAVIGAGPSGLAALKNLLEAGFEDPVAFEANDRVGGNWIYSPRPSHSSINETTRMISSKRLSAFADFPFPDNYPDYPVHTEILEYLTGYARRFGLEKCIRFRTRVDRAEPDGDAGWRLELIDAEGAVQSERFDALMVCNGHHWCPRMPRIPGDFAGRLLHAHDFKHSRDFRGQRVLVIGGGNSGCDIAVEVSRVADATTLSMRRGYHFVPRYLFTVPSDEVASWFSWLPRRLFGRLGSAVLRWVQGTPVAAGFARPDHRLLETHPIVNSKVLRLAKKGRIHPVPDVESFDGHDVRFRDGRVESFDVVIACTGYRIEFPFLDRRFVDLSGDQVELFLRVFHPKHRNLFFIGLVQPVGAIWPLSDLQARLAVAVLAGKVRLPDDLESRARAEVREIKRRFVDSPRHTIEVDFHRYRRRLERWLRPAGRGRQSGSTAVATD